MNIYDNFRQWCDDQTVLFNAIMEGKANLQNELDASTAKISDLQRQVTDYQASVSSLTVQFAAATKIVPRIGVNVHFFNSPIYKDVDRVIADAQAAGFKFFRCDFFTQLDGSIQQEDFFLSTILPKCFAAGIEIQPMLNTPGLSVNSTDIPGQYKLGYVVGFGFANRYGKYFNQYEMGNELGMTALLPGADGRKTENYDKNKLIAIASYLKGMNEGIKAAQITAKTILNGEWLHTAFIDSCKAYGVGFDELSWHWYTHQEGALAEQGWNTNKILIEDYLKTLGFKIRFNEVGFHSGSPFTQTAQSTKLPPLIQRLTGKGYEVAVYELYDQDERLPNPNESTYGVYDNKKVAKDIVGKIKNLFA